LDALSRYGDHLRPFQSVHDLSTQYGAKLVMGFREPRVKETLISGSTSQALLPMAQLVQLLEMAGHSLQVLVGVDVSCLHRWLH
jgi:hypothetical protein